MTIPILVVVSVIVSAYTRLNAVILGQPVSIQPLLLVAVIVILALAVALLWVLRSLLSFRSSPYPRTVS